jgi:hypothetical protein
MHSENMKLSGRVVIETIKEDGSIERDEFDNLIVTAGKTHAALRIASSATAMGWIEVGTGTTAPALADTALQTPLFRKACTVTPSSNTIQYQVTLSPGEGTGAFAEAGIFNASSAGAMLSRVTYPVKNKAAGDTTTITWTITVG